ncbi:hypothetical protein RUM44_001741 [Polyplax serrata]|uniref:S1 motif domain-containing protein n=1 Tax=Polyplax serrata TaxID=468196 RepID=A0ABR1AL75_POLSC
MSFKEKAFPRGGSKPAFQTTGKNISFSVFGTKKSKKSKLKKKIQKLKQKNEKPKKIKHVRNIESLGVKFVEELNPAGVHEGMIVLGIVSKVTEKFVCVSLPGSLKGVVSLLNVSEMYKNTLESATSESEILGLGDMFRPGDVLPVKILSVSESNSLSLTSDPSIINSKLTYDLLQKGLILSGSVRSKEDYGYLIDFGIQLVHGFLRFDRVEREKKLCVGQLVRCAVISCDKSSGACNLQLSMLVNDIRRTYLSYDSNFPLLFFIPGFQFQICTNKALKNGIEVLYNEGNTSKGYIHEDHLVNKFPKLSEVAIGSTKIATLLYIKPLVNIPFFKIMPKKAMELPFQYGEIVSGRVVEARRTGLVVRVVNGNRKAKCFIPLSKLNHANKILEADAGIESFYPVDKKIPRIRLRTVNYMARHYLGATDKASLEEKYYSVSDLKCGEIISGTISTFTKNGAQIKIGNTITGIVDFMDMTDVPIQNPLSRFKIGQEVKARVMEISPEVKFVRLTMKPTLLKKKKILCDTNFKKGFKYTGVVVNVVQNNIMVKFFNGITGIVPKQLTPFPDANSLSEYFNRGQLVKCYVLQVFDANKLDLSMLETDSTVKLKCKKKYKATVINTSQKGLLLEVQLKKDKICNAYIPKELLSIFQDLTKPLHATYRAGDTLSVYCISNETNYGIPVMADLEVFKDIYEGKTEEEVQKLLSINSILPFLCKNKYVDRNRRFLKSLIPSQSNAPVQICRFDTKLERQGKFIKKHQTIYGKVIGLSNNKISVSVKLSDVWDKDFQISLDFLDSYLSTMTTVINRQKAKGNYTDKTALGHHVTGTIQEVRGTHAIVKTVDGDLGLVEGKFTEGQKINGIITWIDAEAQMIHVSANFNPAFENYVKSETPFEPKWTKLHAKVIYHNEQVVVVQLRGKGKGKIAFIPRKRHLNDMEQTENPFMIGDEIKVWVTMKQSKHLLAMDDRIVSQQEKLIWKKSQKKLKESVASLKRKLETEKIELNEKRRRESESQDLEVIKATVNNKAENGYFGEVTEIKQEIEVDDEMFNSTYNSIPHLEYDDVEVKSEEESDNNESLKLQSYNNEKICLSSSSESEDEVEDEKSDSSKAFGVGFNWKVLDDNALLAGTIMNKVDESSDDEDEVSKKENKKARKLTESEKLEQYKTEEQRLRLIEERLMDPDREPETIDDFDRAVLANPDSSALWLKYMAFHIQGTEIEQAKGVARRALKAISFREEQEKLNIWIALLNLENLYGSEEALQKTLSEALQYNEPYKIHIHMLNLYGKSNKLQDMEKLGNFMLKKYKDVENMWIEVGNAYFAVGKVESARLVLQRALTILSKKQHVPIVSKFAQMENKFGSAERAQTLYESILASFPKRVDIWSCYVDMLVKSKLIDLARQVLERATSQSLRPRKMKTLFKKFLTFEEIHGTPENVEKVREAAVDYVQTVGSLES